MDAARMHALACQYAQSPSPEGLDAALDACLPLCALIARRFSGRGAEYDDLFQAACLACVAALKGFEPERGFKFTTFVTPSVTGAVRNCLRSQAGALRASRALLLQIAQLAKAREDHCALHHEEPSPRDLAQALQWDLAQVLNVLSARQAASPASLDQRDEDGFSLGEKLPWRETGYETMERREDLRRAMATLSETEREMLSLRFVQGLSQRETAARLGRTQMQISRMERRALDALRKEMCTES